MKVETNMNLQVDVVPLPGELATNQGASWEHVMETYLLTAIDSENTRKAYRRHLRNAGAALNWVDVDALCGTDLAEYRAAVLATDLAHSSKAQALSAVRAFLNWCRSLGLHTLNSDVLSLVLKTPRVSTQSRYAILTEREIADLLGAGECPRDRAILALLLGAGLRVSEAASLAIADLVEEQDGGMLVFVREGKGRKDRLVPIREDVERLLREYLASTRRFLGDHGRLFLSQDPGAASRANLGLTSRSIATIVGRSAARAGISAKRVSPHCLRHSYAVRCLRAGGNVVAVSRLLGHSSISTTQRYVDHLAVSELRSSVPTLPIAG